MRADEGGQLIDVNRAPDERPGMSSRRLLLFLFPMIAAGAAAAVVASIAAIIGWQRDLMLLTAAGIGAALAIPTLAVVWREIAERREAERELRGVQARVGGILESAMDAIITVDETQHVVLFNKAAEEVFGYSRAQALGACLELFIPQRFHAAHRDLVKKFGDTGESSRRMGYARVVMGLRKDGEEFPIEASISQLLDRGQRYFTVILRDVTARVRAEEALRRSEEEIQSLALAASTAREQEKSRIARELHDELGQALTALKIDVGWLRENPTGSAAAEKLAQMQALLDDTVAAARRISADLRPLMLDDLGLTAATEWLVDNFTARTGIACELVVGAGDLDLPDPYATTVFRVLQECLTNIAKHAAATQAEVTLERIEGEVHLTVHDNGRGFATEVPRPAGSYGLVGLRERAYLINGVLAIDSAPGKGTRIELRVPLAGAGR